MPNPATVRYRVSQVNDRFCAFFNWDKTDAGGHKKVAVSFHENEAVKFPTTMPIVV
jgi:hypothetical protein